MNKVFKNQFVLILYRNTKTQTALFLILKIMFIFWEVFPLPREQFSVGDKLNEIRNPE